MNPTPEQLARAYAAAARWAKAHKACGEKGRDDYGAAFAELRAAEGALAGAVEGDNEGSDEPCETSS